MPFGITTTSNCFPLSLPYINNRRSQLIKQLPLDLHLCQITLDFPLSNLVFELLPGSKTIVAFSKSSALRLATLPSLVTLSSPSTTSPMSRPGSPICLQLPQPNTLLTLPLWTRLRASLPLPLLWPATSRHHLRRRFHNHVTLSSCSSVSLTLRLLLSICLIAALRDPQTHRPLTRPTQDLHHVFQAGPRLRVPPLSPTPPLPWARQHTSTGSETRPYDPRPRPQLALEDHPPPPLGSPPGDATLPAEPAEPSTKPEKLWTTCLGPPASHDRLLDAVRADLAAADELFLISGDQNTIYLIPYA